MATYGDFVLRIPTSLIDELRLATDGDESSMNSFIVQAVAEKIAVLRARGSPRAMTADEQSAYLAGRAARARPGQMAEILAKAGTASVAAPGDEVPEGWLEA